ncbi:MAG: hypothetical protein FJX59_15245 [Alphaproteobacteria bacterium]|nr:hypothetical protein [Alphaproteobacteria bacterium]
MNDIPFTPTLAGFLVPLAIGLTLIWRHKPGDRPFGAANAVTTIRLLMACGLSGLMAASLAQPLSDDLAWSVAALAMAGLLLDGLDGVLARRFDSSTDFGARFDMEVDAFQILVLSILATTMDKAGAWIIAAGLARYLFVGAGLIWPVLMTPLPPSMRRKGVAVIQGVGLAVLAAPILVPPVSSAVAALTLILLLWSFAIDIFWTWGQRQ